MFESSGEMTPLLSNIYLHVLDRVWQRRCGTLGVLIRDADDFVVLCRGRADAKEARGRGGLTPQYLGLEAHPEKTRLGGLWGGQERLWVFRGPAREGSCGGDS